MTMTIGLISDTHGLLRPQAVDALRGSDAILHAGDIGNPAILEELGDIAPVTAVRGNNDLADWARRIPETVDVMIGGITCHILHDLALLAIDPAAAGIQVVVSGHSHRPLAKRENGVLYINPGSAGPRRFTLPISVGRLHLRNGAIEDELIELAIPRY
ncbi:MAG TPA: metallophosphoesterase family protein [Dongiaceae bacterium]|nr:metallophosphoesterase family protein [Dongiaceae bacterium]